MIPDDLEMDDEDESDLDDADDDFDYVDFVDDEEPYIVLCPRCEDRDMMSTETVCHWCAREMWINDNG